MKIIHLISSLDSGGAEAILSQLVSKDKKNKHIVISLTSLGTYGAILKIRNIETYHLNFPKGKLSLKGLAKLYKIIKENKDAHAIQTWMYHADLIGSIFGGFFKIPVFWGIHNTSLEPGKSSRSSIIISKICAKISKKSPRKIISCAQSARKHHESIGYYSDKFITIPNGYDIERFSPDEKKRNKIRNEFNIKNEDLVFANIARYDPYKDHKNLINSFGLLKEKNYNFILILTGSGINEENKSLVDLIKSHKLQDNVIMTGQRNDVDSILNAADFHVLSSSAEAFPNVLAEAMACGIPCITTDVGDARLIIDRYGWINPINSPNKLFDNLEKAILIKNNNEKINLLKQNCRKHIVENYSIEKMIKNYISSWENNKTH